jgi:formylmethanofuran dehydrogenase subunit D
MVEQKLSATLITGRTIDQGVGKEMGKGSKEYFDSSSVCFIDKSDMLKLGIRSGTNVQVASKYGSVIVHPASPISRSLVVWPFLFQGRRFFVNSSHFLAPLP